MWSLTFATGGDNSVFHVQSCGDVIKVGRHEYCQLHIAGDQSVSRVHCHLQAKRISNGGTELTVTDCHSKFGTFINGQPLKPDLEYTLHAGDRIKFGAVNSEYTVHHNVTEMTNLTKATVVEMLLNGSSIPASVPFKPKHMDRTILFSGLSFKPGPYDDIIIQCGGQINDGGEEWTEEEIYDAVLFGKLRSKPNTRVTVIAELKLPPQPAKMITAKNTTIQNSSVATINVKRFRKVQPLTLPDIIGLSDMSVHNRNPQPPQMTTTTTIATKSYKINDENVGAPPPPVHPEYQPKRPIESYFESTQITTKRAKPQLSTTEAATSVQDFQSDFFRSLL